MEKHTVRAARGWGPSLLISRSPESRLSKTHRTPQRGKGEEAEERQEEEEEEGEEEEEEERASVLTPSHITCMNYFPFVFQLPRNLCGAQHVPWLSSPALQGIRQLQTETHARLLSSKAV